MEVSDVEAGFPITTTEHSNIWQDCVYMELSTDSSQGECWLNGFILFGEQRKELSKFALNGWIRFALRRAELRVRLHGCHLDNKSRTALSETIGVTEVKRRIAKSLKKGVSSKNEAKGGLTATSMTSEFRKAHDYNQEDSDAQEDEFTIQLTQVRSKGTPTETSWDFLPRIEDTVLRGKFSNPLGKLEVDVTPMSISALVNIDSPDVLVVESDGPWKKLPNTVQGVFEARLVKDLLKELNSRILCKQELTTARTQ